MGLSRELTAASRSSVPEYGLDLAATIVALPGPAAAVLAVPLAWHLLHDLLAEHAASQGH